MGNRANKLLCIVAVFFLAAQYLKIRYPSIYSDAIVFCLEAALVGGIADWFAVTALFKRPLGIPWHTAILPRHRKAFTEATIRLVQRQFFTKKIVLNQVKALNAPQKVIFWLNGDVPKNALVQNITEYFLQKIRQLDSNTIEKVFADMISDKFTSKKIISYGLQYLQTNSVQEIFINKLSILFADKISGEDGIKTIEGLLERFEKEKLKAGSSSFLFSLGGALNVINNKECAKLVQSRLITFAKQLNDVDSDVHKKITSVMDSTVKELGKADLCNQSIQLLLNKLLKSPLPEKICAAYINELKSQLNPMQDKDLHEAVQTFVKICLEKSLQLVNTDAVIYRNIGAFINDALQRCALQAQNMLGNIIRRALDTMTDEELNKIIRSKTDTDLIWIRMNGSIVGGSIGLILFIIVQMIK